MTTKPFYNTGAAVLTNGSKNMVGTGTFWAGNIRQFDRVVGADGSENIVDVVVDNTHITLLDNWTGATQASGIYKIWMSPDEIFLQTAVRLIMDKLASSALVGIGGLTPAANTFPYFDNTNTANLATISAFALTMLDDANAAAARVTLGAMGGALGAIDNALLRADGTGGVTAQGSTGATLADDGTLTINKNAVALPAPFSGSNLQIGGADGIGAAYQINTFANYGRFIFDRANGTGAAKTAIALNDVLGSVDFRGYGISTFATSAAIRATASQAFTESVRGTRVEIQTTPIGSITMRTTATFDVNGDFSALGGIFSQFLTVTNPTNGSGITLNSTGSGGHQWLIFSSDTASGLGAGRLGFYDGGVTRAFFETTGELTLNNALRVDSGQIRFPATQNPSSDANTLDDYEEGTFTPGATFGGAAVGLTYSTRKGFYRKIASFCAVYGEITLSNKGSSTGNAVMTGLPFTSNATFFGGLQTSLLQNFSGLTGTISGYVDAGSTNGVLLNPSTTATPTLTNANFSNTSYFLYHGHYATAN